MIAREHEDPTVERLVTAIDGPLRTNLDGSVYRDRKRGMDYKIDQIYKTRARRRLPLGQFWGGIGSILAVLIGYLEVLN